MSSSWGNFLHLSLFGESHGPAVGAVLEGLPPGEEIDLALLQTFCGRRSPGRSPFVSPRTEQDQVKVLSGLYLQKTTGTPMALVIENHGQNTKDYPARLRVPRPGHADYSAHLRYRGFADPRGGGHHSGRLTAPLCAVGGIALQILRRRGIVIGAHLSQLQNIKDTPLDPVCVDAKTLTALSEKDFPVIDPAAEENIKAAILDAKNEGNSLGGIVTCAGIGIPAGIGSPIFNGLENRISSLLFGIPAIKGVSFGDGFSLTQQTGANSNDAFVLENGKIQTKTNHQGGILGGISSGMPIVFHVAVKPTPSIASAQQSVDLITHEPCEMQIGGRHDPCVALRAVVCVEAAFALAVLDALLEVYGATKLPETL